MQLHRAYDTICLFRSELELDALEEDVSLPTLDAIVEANIGEGDDNVSTNKGFQLLIWHLAVTSILA